MNGQVDRHGRALIAVSLIPSPSAAPLDISAWIDTGFNGDLVLPQEQVISLGLTHSGTVQATLADGSVVALKTYGCQIDWFGERRYLEVVANSGMFPLLGVGLLRGHDLRINYRSDQLTLD